MPNLDRILPLVGLQAIRFGSSLDLVRNLLGRPGSETADEWGDVHLEYPDLGLTFTFWRAEGLKLGVISSSRATAVLGDAQLVGESDQAVRDFVWKVLSSQVTEEEHVIHGDGRIQSWIDVDSHMITFWFEEGRLCCIDWFSAWTDDDTPSWPIDKGLAE